MLPNPIASTPLTIAIALVTLNWVSLAPKVVAAEPLGHDWEGGQLYGLRGEPFIASASYSERLVLQPFDQMVGSAHPTVLESETRLLVQTIPADVPDALPLQTLPRDPIPPELPLPEELPSPLPPPAELLQPSESAPIAPELPPSEVPQTVFVEQLRVEGSTVFDADELAALAWQATLLSSDDEIDSLIGSYCRDRAPTPAATDPAQTGEPSPTAEVPSSPTQPVDLPQNIVNGDIAGASPQTGRELSFEQLLRARSTITQLYIKCGYITSGAILPPQTPEEQGNLVVIQVVEGRLEGIEVTGLRRLNPGYVSSRLALAGAEPLNQRQLLQGLQLLQLDPQIQRISADLQAGTRPATSILQVEAIEADTFEVALDLNNNRSPSVGIFQRGLTFTQANLLGFGDGLRVTYNNTDGSNGIEGSYTIPVSPRNATVSLRGGYTGSRVIEQPFNILDITSDSFYYDLTFRQPIFQTPTEEFALGLTFSRQESQTSLGIGNIGPFPLSRGADANGKTQISALRFTQDWLKRTPRRVLAARSQFSLGLDLFGATINADPLPDSRFFAWRGQGQWVQLLNDSGTLLLVRTEAQLATDDLLPLEQFGLGGQDTVRGYRQDALLADSGLYGSAEVRFPVWRMDELQATLYLTPFIDAGTGWNVDPSTNPDNTTLVGTGLGLLWTAANQFTARIDWGIPLISSNAREQTWQESGVYFSIRYSAF